jgi:hypothetical protein
MAENRETSLEAEGEERFRVPTNANDVADIIDPSQVKENPR